jgi:uncharacterized protein (DUF4213/DUF364 family)
MEGDTHLAAALLDSVKDRDARVDRVCVGLHWTAVGSRAVGMSHTYKTSRKVELAGSGDLEGGSAFEMAERMLSWEPLEASLGVAALNSLIDAKGEIGNVKDLILERAPGRTVTVIGRFPFNDDIRKVAGKAYFLEMEPRRDELPATAAERVIPRSDMAIITATALINHTLQRLLELTVKGECYAVVLGPSTPMLPVLFDLGVDVLAGLKVKDQEALFKSISHGAKTFKRLAGTEPIFMEKDRNRG